jgi:hypothetical protein
MTLQHLTWPEIVCFIFGKCIRASIFGVAKKGIFYVTGGALNIYFSKRIGRYPKRETVLHHTIAETDTCSVQKYIYPRAKPF